MDTISSFYFTVQSYVWDEKVWFPPGVNWTTLRSVDHEGFPDFYDMYYPIAYSFVVLLIRTVFEWSIARPLGILFGIKDTSSELENVFQKIYRKLRRPSSSGHPLANGTLCSANGKKVANGSRTDSYEANGARTESYEANGTRGESFEANGHVVGGRKRTKSESKMRLVIPKSTLDKFAESCWRFTFYFSIFWYGIYVLWDKPWFWDTAHCWYGYPFQRVDDEIWWYYMVEAAFYWSLCISQFVDVHRKVWGIKKLHVRGVRGGGPEISREIFFRRRAWGVIFACRNFFHFFISHILFLPPSK